MVKKVFVGLLILVILIVGSLIAVPYIFKDDIVKLLKTEANKTVNAKIDFGNFDLSLIKSFPDFYFSIEGIKVDGIAKFEGVQLANIKEIDLVVDLMSVIKGESINIKRISILEPTINTIVMADGSTNYDIGKTDSTALAETKVSSSNTSFKMELQQFDIVDGILKYNDAIFSMLMNIDGLNISLQGDFTENITNLKIEGGVNQLSLDYDGIKYMNQVKVFLDMMLEMNLEEAKYTFIENEFGINELLLSFDGWVAMPSDAIDMDLTFKAKKTEFKEILSLIPAEFTKDLEGVETSGKMSLSGYAKGIYLEENYPSFGAKLQVENARFQYPDLPKSVEDIQILASIENLDGNLDHMVVDVQKFHLVMADNPLDINVLVKTPMSDPFIKAGMKGKIILDNIKDVIPLEKNDELTGQFIADLAIEGNLSTIEKEQYEDFKAKGTMQVMNIHYNSESMDHPVDLMEAEMVFSPQFVALNKMNIKLGESDILATGILENFIGFALKDNQVLKGNLVMTSTYMNLDELLGMEDESAASAEGEAAVDSSLMEVVLVPKNIDFTISTIIGKVLYDGLVVENINGAINLKDERISMQEVSMNLLKGSMFMNGYYETSDNLVPSYDFAMNVTDFDLQETMQNFNAVEQLAPIAKYGSGLYSTNLDVKGRLDQNMEPNFDSMSGKVKIKTKSISIDGYKPLTKVADLLKYDKLTPLIINDADITFQIVQGKIFVDPFTNMIGKTEMTISGSNSFDKTIDYVFAFTIPREEFGGAANQAVDGLLAKAAANGVDLSGAIDVVNVDVTLKGPTTDPKISTNFKKSTGDVKETLKAKAKTKLDAAKQKAQEELEKKKKELENQGMEELEKQKQKAEEELQKQKEAAKKKLEEEAKKKLKGLLRK